MAIGKTNAGGAGGAELVVVSGTIANGTNNNKQVWHTIPNITKILAVMTWMDSTNVDLAKDTHMWAATQTDGTGRATYGGKGFYSESAYYISYTQLYDISLNQIKVASYRRYADIDGETFYTRAFKYIVIGVNE